MPSKYKIYPKARFDLEIVWRDGFKKWGESRADAYIDDLASFFSDLSHSPTLYRERTEFTPPVRLCACGSHIVVYVVDQDIVHIVRVLHKSVDIHSILHS